MPRAVTSLSPKLLYSSIPPPPARRQHPPHRQRDNSRAADAARRRDPASSGHPRPPPLASPAPPSLAQYPMKDPGGVYAGFGGSLGGGGGHCEEAERRGGKSGLRAGLRRARSGGGLLMAAVDSRGYFMARFMDSVSPFALDMESRLSENMPRCPEIFGMPASRGQEGSADCSLRGIFLFCEA